MAKVLRVVKVPVSVESGEAGLERAARICLDELSKMGGSPESYVTPPGVKRLRLPLWAWPCAALEQYDIRIDATRRSVRARTLVNVDA